MKQANSISGDNFAEPITEREREILALIAEHRSNKEIAESLNLALSTVKWYTKQIYSKLAVDDRRAAVERATALGILGTVATTTHPNNLPIPGTSFVGREKEIEKISDMLTRDGVRLITLQGFGGCGKTRLAIQTASRLVASGKNYFPDGVWFIPLTSLQSHDLIIQLIGNTTGCTFFDEDSEHLQQLTDYLHPKHLLLILDNFEHLISSQSLRIITEIITKAPYIKLLTTSRIRLNLREEQLFPVTGMKTPGYKGTHGDDWHVYSAIQLFMTCAQSVRPEFELNNDNLPFVIQICQLVEGMPLGIELAARWLEILTPSEIVSEIANSLDFLASDQADVPIRQRSIRAVFESSWNLLTKEEKTALSRLCVFRGTFSREAAQQVSGADLQTLLKLSNKSWLGQTDGGRYQLHELLRQYSEEKLKENTKEWNQANNNHAEYFSNLVEEQSIKMRGPDQLAGLHVIHKEFNSNIKTAWDWLIEQRRWDKIIEKLIFELYSYVTIYRRNEDFVPWLRKARQIWMAQSETREHLAFAILGTLEVYCEVDDKTDAHLERLKAIWQLVAKHKLAEQMGFWYVLLASLVQTENIDPNAKMYLDKAVAHVRKQNEPWLVAMSLLIQSNWWQEFSVIEDKLLEASKIFKTLGVLYEQGLVAEIQEILAVQQKRPLEVIRHYFQQKKVFFQKMGDLYPRFMEFYYSTSYYFQVGEIEQGFTLFHEQQSFYEQFGLMQRVAYSLSWESQFAARYSNFDHAFRTRERALEILRNLDHPSDIAWSLYESGEIFRVFGDQEKAIEFYEQAHTGFAEMNIILGLGYYERSYGDIALQNARYSDALTYYLKYYEYASQDNHLWSMAHAHAKLALAYSYLGQVDRSRKEILTALSEMHAWGKDDLMLQTLLAEPVCLAQEDRLEEAIELSAFINAHPVSWNETKNQARTILAKVGSQGLPELVEMAEERGKTLKLEEIVNGYIQTK